MARKRYADGGLVLNGTDPRPDADQAKQDLQDKFSDEMYGNDWKDPSQNGGKMEKNGGWGGGVGPTPLNLSNKNYMEKHSYAGGGAVTARGQQTLAKLRAKCGKDV